MNRWDWATRSTGYLISTNILHPQATSSSPTTTKSFSWNHSKTNLKCTTARLTRQSPLQFYPNSSTNCSPKGLYLHTTLQLCNQHTQSWLTRYLNLRLRLLRKKRWAVWNTKVSALQAFHRSSECTSHKMADYCQESGTSNWNSKTTNTTWRESGNQVPRTHQVRDPRCPICTTSF
jgi:hypothetical protein